MQLSSFNNLPIIAFNQAASGNISSVNFGNYNHNYDETICYGVFWQPKQAENILTALKAMIDTDGEAIKTTRGRLNIYAEKAYQNNC